MRNDPVRHVLRNAKEIGFYSELKAYAKHGFNHYELEEILSDKDFVRTSKSQLVNINKIKSLKPELNRSITAEMMNGEILFISRRYAKQIKTLLSI